MVFLKTRTVKGIEYYYAAETEGDSQKDVYYFGKKKPTKYGWQAVLNALENKDDYYPKKPEMKRPFLSQAMHLPIFHLQNRYCIPRSHRRLDY